MFFNQLYTETKSIPKKNIANLKKVEINVVTQAQRIYRA